MALLFSSIGAQASGDKKPGQIVVASIKPLALITKDLLVGTDIEVDTLLNPASSPHNYALKVSDAARLREAGLVIWLGAGAEPYIKAKQLTHHLALLEHLPREQLIEDKDHGHHSSVDPHFWLDPEMAKAAARLIGRQLMTRYPQNKNSVEENLRHFLAQQDRTDQKINSLLAPQRDKGFLVYHRGYEYFVRRYGLRQLGAIQEQIGGGGLSVAHLAELQHLAQQSQAICLFSEPQFSLAVLPSLGAGFSVQTGQLDPLGVEVSSYKQLLESLANQMVTCLSRI